MAPSRSMAFGPLFFILALDVRTAATVERTIDRESGKGEDVLALLKANSVEIRSKQHSLSALEELRSATLTGERAEWPSAERQHLEAASPLINQISFDARHRPIASNVTRQFHFQRHLAPSVEVMLFDLLPLKRITHTNSKYKDPASLLMVIDEQSKLNVYNPEESLERPLLGAISLNHGPERKIVVLATTRSQENHLFATADDQGSVRVHSLRVVVRAKDNSKSNEGVERLNVTANYSCNFSLPMLEEKTAEGLHLTSLVIVDRGDKSYFVAGDSLGGISVFKSDCSLKGRMRVTEDLGGVRGLLVSTSSMLTFFSSHSFGLFSPSQVSVLYPPCSGWNSPAHDVILDPNFQSSNVLVSLADGDVLVFATMRGKMRTCDLSMKLPHISAVPFKLNSHRGHVVALTSPLEDAAEPSQHARELYFFNLAGLEEGYGPGHSRAITLHVPFYPKRPVEFVITPAPGVAGQIERAKAYMAVRHLGMKGIELYTLNLKPLTNVVSSPDPFFAPDLDDLTWWGWLCGLSPKIGIFALTIVVVVVWNLRKVMNGGEEFDEAFFREQLRIAREVEKAEKKAEKNGRDASANS